MRAGQLEPFNDYRPSSPQGRAHHPRTARRLLGGREDLRDSKGLQHLALFFNKDLFDFAGVPYPDEDDDWNSLADKLRRVAELGPDFYGWRLAPEFARMGAFAYATGWQPFDENGHTNVLDPRFVEAFKWYTGLLADRAGVHPADVGQGWGGGAHGHRAGGGRPGGGVDPRVPPGRGAQPGLPVPRRQHPGTGERGNLIFTVRGRSTRLRG